ncbi:SRA stem-loop-interacting RNA-binding protein, mitochondrial [Pantherophis guttatus]|uniref:SRA stem-loop-interacting RNA-binding protein, mitochondrial n=1 Tax=Pantherophis guttatus TaxID=94885 RepID=A0A6P9C3D1_PANGU|nr:SRA stem-loop-interacting RNA-binding protein, mitochondrial [Pantherophis guttatus]
MAARGVSRRAFEVFVRRIPWNVEENELREYFTQFGPVKKCILPFNVETGFHKGFAWIGFSTEESRSKALLKDHFFEGSQLEVKRQEKTVR